LVENKFQTKPAFAAVVISMIGVSALINNNGESQDLTVSGGINGIVTQKRLETRLFGKNGYRSKVQNGINIFGSPSHHLNQVIMYLLNT
jgi:hypothetical protein